MTTAAVIAMAEPFVDIETLVKHFCMSRRWLEYRISDGMPSRRIGACRRFRVSECEAWLVKEGFIREES